MSLTAIATEQELSLTRVGSLGDLVEFNLIESPAPGIYHDMESEHYHRIHAASNSRLKQLQKSPAHLLYSMTHPTEPTPALIQGSAIHARILEPNRFNDQYAIMKKVDGRTKVGKEYKENFEIENMGKTVLDQDTGELAERIAESLYRSPLIASFLDAPGQVEASAFWTAANGVPCKMRADKVLELNGERIILDVKTTEDASGEGFTRSIFKYGYHIQAAMYLDGWEAAGGGKCDHFVFLAVEKSGPLAPNIYRLDDEAIDIGRREYRRLLDIYKKCIETDTWPGYLNPADEMISPITLPSWAFRGEATAI